MHTLFLGIALLSQMSFCLESLDDKLLPEDFVQKIAEKRKCMNYSFYWYLHLRTRPITAKELYSLCEYHAKRVDGLCERKEDILPDNCTLYAHAQRHLSCWWLHKQALYEAFKQK